MGAAEPDERTVCSEAPRNSMLALVITKANPWLWRGSIILVNLLQIPIEC